MTNKMTLKKLLELKQRGSAEIISNKTETQLPYGNPGTVRIWKTKSGYYYESAESVITRIYPEPGTSTEDIIENIDYLYIKSFEKEGK